MAKVSFEFVIQGPPFSVNSAKKQPHKHNRWKAEVGRAAREQWIKDNRALADLPLNQPTEIMITTFFQALALDVDNVVKPILDGLKGVLYVDDKDIYKLISQRFDLNTIADIDFPTPLLMEALGETQELVYIVLTWEKGEE